MEAQIAEMQPTTTLQINPSEYGLEKHEAEQIQAVFIPMLEKLKDMEDEYNAIVALELTPEASSKAKTLRLKFVKIRTGTAEIHKKAKAYYLNGGRAVDGLKNTVTFAITGKEDVLDKMENHFENLEKERIANLQLSRQAEVEIYGAIAVSSLGSMQDDVWNNYISGVKSAHEVKIKAEKEAEEQRLLELKKEEERKEAERIENERIRIENERLRKENEAKEAEQKALIETANKELQRVKDEAEKERLEAEKKARIEREARETQERKEKVLAAQKLEAEQKAREKAESELNAQREARVKEEKERIAAEKKAAKAPDKVKLKTWISELSIVEVSVATPEGIEVAKNIHEKFLAFQNWANQQIETL